MVENARELTNNRMQIDKNNFRIIYGNRKNIAESPNELIVYKRIVKTQRSPWGGNTPGIAQGNTDNNSNLENHGPDCIHGFWFNKFMSIHDRLILQLK